MQNINQENKTEDRGKIFSDGYAVSVAFLGNKHAYYFHTYDANLTANTPVVVETTRGIELGTVSGPLVPVEKFPEGMYLKDVLRKATPEDLENFKKNLEKAKEALRITTDAVEELGLDMRLLTAEYTLDASKVTVVYVAEARVDFRELLRILAYRLHCRIELRQIGSRDRSKIIGGLGLCGLPLCCNAFLKEFEGISINIAKNQFLVLNIQKLSGQCGKLLCCLKYENDQYSELRQGLPKIGQRVNYDGEKYKIGSINVLSREARLENKENVKTISLDELTQLEIIAPVRREKPKEEK